MVTYEEIFDGALGPLPWLSNQLVVEKFIAFFIAILRNLTDSTNNAPILRHYINFAEILRTSKSSGNLSLATGENFITLFCYNRYNFLFEKKHIFLL